MRRRGGHPREGRQLREGAQDQVPVLAGLPGAAGAGARLEEGTAVALPVWPLLLVPLLPLVLLLLPWPPLWEPPWLMGAAGSRSDSISLKVASSTGRSVLPSHEAPGGTALRTRPAAATTCSRLSPPSE